MTISPLLKTIVMTKSSLMMSEIINSHTKWITMKYGYVDL